MDKTTLSRNLRVLARAGWIEVKDLEGSRERRVAVTAPGRRALAEARPAWQAAQTALQRAMSPPRWREVHASLRLLTDAARQATRRRQTRKAE